MIDEAVAAFRGTYLQQPPAYSAKKVEGDRAYDLARRNATVLLEPVQVTATRAGRHRLGGQPPPPAPRLLGGLLRAVARRMRWANNSALALTWLP